MNQINQLILIVGPTATGKSLLALELAKLIPIEIISADSRQVYKHLSIGTAKPNQEELKSVAHHLIDFLEPDQDYNAGRFVDDALVAIDQINKRKRIPVIVGGTGLYINALLDGLSIQSPSDTIVREQLETEFNQNGLDKLYQQLKALDPVSAKQIHPHNKQHIMRALEICIVSGKAKSDLQNGKGKSYTGKFQIFALDWSREDLYEQINRRVEQMINNGLIDEVNQLIKMGFNASLNSLKTVGYKEVFDFLTNRINQKKMIELIQQNSRRYAKRQLTWFRKDKRINWIECNSTSNFDLLAKQIVEIAS